MAFDRFLEGVADNRQVAFDDAGWRLKSDAAEQPDPAQSESLAELHRLVGRPQPLDPASRVQVLLLVRDLYADGRGRRVVLETVSPAPRRRPTSGRIRASVPTVKQHLVADQQPPRLARHQPGSSPLNLRPQSLLSPAGPGPPAELLPVVAAA